MKKPETKFKELVIKDLKTLKNTWFFKSQEVSRRGIPDLILCVNGFFVAMELKVDSDLDALQIYNINKIKEANGWASEVTPKNWKKVFAYLKKLSEE